MERWIWIVGILLLLSGCEEKGEDRKAIPQEPQGKIEITHNAISSQAKEDGGREGPDQGEFYYSYKRQSSKEEPSIEDEGRYTKLGAYRYVKNYTDVQIALLANKLSREFLIYCSACHDDYANGVIGPSLLGKSGEYIYEQLMQFRRGERKNVLMEQLVRRLPEETLRALAEEIAKFNQEVQKIKEQNSVKG
ncbi:MAG: hypothetical protein C6I00_05280 [Nitratiruptor sp.]|nr:hypothetical protein [Nitratiruptor sp.]NPA83511.1 hypothetical protein [Campylobacterota bacterium]